MPALDCLAVGILVADHLCAPIPRLPNAGELILADELPLTTGGCAANTAIDLAHAGFAVGAVGCVGNDAFGKFLIDSLRQQGVQIQGIRTLSGVGTSGTLIINVQGQDRRFIHTLGANGRLRVEDVPMQAVLSARVLYVGGYLLMSDFQPEPLRMLFAAARAAGVKTVLDVVLPGPGDHWPRFERLLAETDVFLPNCDEAAIITGLADPVQQAERFLAAGAGCVVITCGGAGAVMMTPRLRVRSGVYPIEFVGGTGAGDAFDAGFICGMLLGEEAIGCLKWGSAMGASCVRAIGATQSVFTRDEACQFMQRHELSIQPL